MFTFLCMSLKAYMKNGYSKLAQSCRTFVYYYLAFGFEDSNSKDIAGQFINAQCI